MEFLNVLYKSIKGEMIVKVGERFYYVDECKLWDESIFEDSSVYEIWEFLEEGGWERIGNKS